MFTLIVHKCYLWDTEISNLLQFPAIVFKTIDANLKKMNIIFFDLHYQLPKKKHTPHFYNITIQIITNPCYLFRSLGYSMTTIFKIYVFLWMENFLYIKRRISTQTFFLYVWWLVINVNINIFKHDLIVLQEEKY